MGLYSLVVQAQATLMERKKHILLKDGASEWIQIWTMAYSLITSNKKKHLQLVFLINKISIIMCQADSIGPI